jgi:shikimate dehydrogenase
VTGPRRLAVLGSPIAHSRSPLLHSAASGVLGLDWEYERVEVTGGELAAFVGGLGPDWRGLSLTMPLKESVLPLAARLDETSLRAGAANTLVFDDGGPSAFNTDVDGIGRALRARGVAAADTAVLLGTGATARSAVLALERMGIRRLIVAGRTPNGVAAILEFAGDQGISAEANPDGLAFAAWPAADLVVSTLPSAAAVTLPVEATAATLFDAAYGDSPSALTSQWTAAGAASRALDGLDMLVQQALLQVRAFVSGSVDVPLPDEEAVLRAMLAAVGRS